MQNRLIQIEEEAFNSMLKNAAAEGARIALEESNKWITFSEARRIYGIAAFKKVAPFVEQIQSPGGFTKYNSFDIRRRLNPLKK